MLTPEHRLPCASRAEPRRLRSGNELIVIFRRLLQLPERGEIVLDPKLRAGFLEEDLDVGPRLDGLVAVELVHRNLAELALLRVVIQVAAEHHRAGFGELQKENLVRGRMSR